jgi:hypothetical protein
MKNRELITSKTLLYIQGNKIQEYIFTFLKSKELSKLLANKNIIYKYIDIYHYNINNALDIIDFLVEITNQTHKNDKLFDLKKEELILKNGEKIYYFYFSFEYNNKIFKFKLPALTD